MRQIQRPQIGWTRTALGLLLLATLVAAAPSATRDTTCAVIASGTDTTVPELCASEGGPDGSGPGSSESFVRRADDVRFAVAAMPVPGTAWLLLGGFLAIAAKRRTQRRE